MGSTGQQSRRGVGSVSPQTPPAERVREALRRETTPHGEAPASELSNNSPERIIDQTRVLPDYLPLYLTSRRGSAALAAAATGTVISNLRRDALQDIEINLPDLETQKNMVEIMSSVEMQLREVSATLKAIQDLYDTSSEGFAAGAFAPKRETEQGEGS